MYLHRSALLAFIALWVVAMSMAQQPGRAPYDRPREGKLRVGDPAPDFNLQVLGKEEKIRLSSFRGIKPVVLIFGSYT